MTARRDVQLVVGIFDSLGSDARIVRDRVFITEQAVPPGIEVDGRDGECVHVVVYLCGAPIATGRIAPDGKVGRVAVMPAHRGQGLGRIVMEALEAEARRSGLERVWFHAQESAIGFYERLGYRCYGEPFVEAGIPHVAMERPVTAH